MKNFTFLICKGRGIYCITSILLFLVLTITSSFVNSPDLSPATAAFIDTDGDGVEDEGDIDDDGDGILDVVEGTNTDSDGDGIMNHLDLDSDNDGILDNVEAQSATTFILPSNQDVNGDGLDDSYQGSNGLTPIDSDGDNVSDYIDLDSDGDGLLDNAESSVLSTDFDCDTIPNLDFSNEPVLESGDALNEGAVYRFEGIADGLDALVTIASVVNGELATLDQNEVDPEFFKPEI